MFKYFAIKQDRTAVQENIKRILMMVVIFIIASGLGFIFRYALFPDSNVVVVYLLAVLLIAWLTQSFIFGFLASVLATFAYNYFFAEPYYAFTVNDPNYIITFITMTVTALVTSTLTTHAKQSALEAREKEAETKAIYNLTNRLTEAKDMHDIAGIAISAISKCFSCEAACLCFDDNGMPEHTYIQQMTDGKQIRREVDDVRQIKHQMDWLRTDHDIGDEFFDWPVSCRETTLGIIRIPKEQAQTMTETQIRLLRAMFENIALVMDRFRAAEQRIKSREETIKERYRSNLLRAISHDLRTPLSAIIGTSEMLMGMTEPGDPRHDMIKGIHTEADWLHSMVENILNLTGLQDGKLALKKQPEAVEEIVGGAIGHVMKRFPEHEITVSMPDELLLVPMDAKLIEQVFINLLDNAIKHTKPGSEISIAVEPEDEAVRFYVRDRGKGIKKNDLSQVFQAFYTTRLKHADSGHGIGLGLAICEAIVKAHGGSIEARNRTDVKGAEFTFTLPQEKDENE